MPADAVSVDSLIRRRPGHPPPSCPGWLADPIGCERHPRFRDTGPPSSVPVSPHTDRFNDPAAQRGLCLAVVPDMARKPDQRIHRVSRLCLVAFAIVLYVTHVSAAPIVIDGSFEDWSNVPVAATDPLGDSARFLGAVTDLLSVRLTNDATNLYALLTYAETPFLGALLFNTDNDAATGATVIGAEYGLCFRSAPPSAVVDTFAGGLCNGSPGILVPAFAFGGTSIEAAIPLGIFLGLTPGFNGTFTFNTGGIALDTLARSQVFSTIPEPSAVLLFGTGAAALIAARTRKKQKMRR